MPFKRCSQDAPRCRLVLQNNFAGNALTDVSALSLDGLSTNWQTILQQEQISESLRRIKSLLAQELDAKSTIYPADPWRALRLLDLPSIKVVILGQDPYHGANQAQGLAFSVNRHIKVPPSLRNMFAEIARDPNLEIPALSSTPDPDLTRWAQQGVLLLNTSLTVRDGQAASHAKWGWQTITDAIIDAVAKQTRHCVFMLWGAHAQAKRGLVEPYLRNHLVLSANHPSPLSARRPPEPFIGCGHFSSANQWLAERGLDPIKW